MNPLVEEVMRLAKQVQLSGAWGVNQGEMMDKLRAFLEQHLVVREPLTVKQIEQTTGVKRDAPNWLVAAGFIRIAERAHGIIEKDET